MSWPCPDCGEPFVPDHMCPTLRARLTGTGPSIMNSWPWLARALMLEAHRAQQAFLVEQSLRTGYANESSEHA